MSMLPLRAFGSAPSRVLIAGGGVAGVEAMLALRALAGERVSIELLAPEHEFVYRPLAVLEPFKLGEAPRLELASIAADAGARHRLDALAEVDIERQRVRTRSGGELPYDVLVIATGARLCEAIPGALTFRGQEDGDAFLGLLDEIESGAVRDLVFAVPGRVVWTLPIYELALMTAAHLEDHNVTGVELSVATPETAPLGLFGQQASEAVFALLANSGITLQLGSYPLAVENGGLALVPDVHIPADRVVALPRPEGPRIPDLPQGPEGFIRTDSHGLAPGLSEVYAAGDATAFPIKQGGVAAEQADAVAEAIAARVGARLKPEPFRPVLRGLLFSGAGPRYLWAEITGGGGDVSEAQTGALWWPPGKVTGRFLAPYLAKRGEVVSHPPPAAGTAAIPVEVDLESAASEEEPVSSGADRAT